MLYVSTRNTTDTFTAHRALLEAYAPDGGRYVPFHLPVFSSEEMAELRALDFCEVIANILNLFFGLRLKAYDVECLVGRAPVRLSAFGLRLTVAELWRNPEGSYRYLQKSLYNLMTDGKSAGKTPSGWPRIAIDIAMLFGLYASMEDNTESFDIALTTGDFSGLTAVFYAKDMGLPTNTTICACSENGAVWDLLNRGEFLAANTSENNDTANYLECFLFKSLGVDEVNRYLNACSSKGTYRIDEIQREALTSCMYAAVVSERRIDSVVSSIYRMNGYQIDPYAALAYGALQDYRAQTGISRETVLPARLRPARIKE